MQLLKYVAECSEWRRIAEELTQRNSMVTAFDVSEEQRRRMALRGERPMTHDEILAEAAASGAEK